MARKSAIKHVKDEFVRRIDSSANLYTAVIEFTKSDTHEAIQGYEALHPGQARRIISLAFLDMISQGDVFVENCFIRFLAGANFLNGTAPKLRVKNCLSIKHAYQLLTLKEKYDPTTSYLSFNSWSQVEEKAKIFFQHGKPFSLLDDLEKARLRDAIIIRNRVAHYSQKSRSQFVKMSKRTLNLEKLQSGFSVGHFLTQETDQHFANPKQQAIFFHYMDLFHKLGGKISK
jgi:hypothetical protein